MKILAALLLSVLPYVNPMIGTGGHGHTFPGAAYPFGSVQLGPDTRRDVSDRDGSAGYHYSDSLIYGFSHTHLSGSGTGAFCDLLIMPAADMPDTLDRAMYASPFSHSTEVASPGYYEVFLEKPRVRARMTVGQRAAMHEYTFPDDVTPMLVIDLAHGDSLTEGTVKMDRNNSYSVYGQRKSAGWAHTRNLYFYIEFSRPVIHAEIDSTGAVLTFRPGKQKKLTVRVGLSSVSCNNARINMMEECMDGGEFDTLRLRTAQEWNKFLSTVDCPFEDDRHRTIFYTALYHCAIHPSLYSDFDGSYMGCNGQMMNAAFDRFTIFPLSHTFRGVHPLLADLSHEMAYTFLDSFNAIYQEQGKMPVSEVAGCETPDRTGYHSAPVVADCVARGLTDFDVTLRLAQLAISSNITEPGMAAFRTEGCIQADDAGQSVSRTLEYAYDDWCVAQIARFVMDNIGPGEKYDACKMLYERFMVSCQYWRNLFDPVTGVVRPRANGRWLEPFDPDEASGHFSEGNAWMNTFMIPHDIVGLMRALGGRSGLISRLDAFFGDPGQMGAGIIPHHIPHLYSFAGRPERTVEVVKDLMETLYSDSPDGLCRPDGFGEASAWYVLNALGTYPVCPGAREDELTWVPKTIVVNPVFEMETDEITDTLTVGISNIDQGCRAWYRIGQESEFRMYEGPFLIDGPCLLESYAMAPDGRKSFIVKSVIKKKE